MSNLIAVRQFWRPDQPQPVFKGAIPGLFEAFRWPAIQAGTDISFRSRDRAQLDPRFPPQVTSWIFANLPAGPTQAQLWPAINLGQQSWYRVPWKFAHPTPIFNATTNDFGLPVPDATVAQQVPAWRIVGYRSPDRPVLDVRTVWSPTATQFAPLDALVARWGPVFAAELRGFRALDDPALSLYGQHWATRPAWQFGEVDSIVRTWGPAFATELKSERSRDGKQLSLYGQDWFTRPDWLRTVVDSIIRTWIPAITSELRSDRSGEGGKLRLYGQEWLQLAWIFTSIPIIVSTAQMWPAILEALSPGYRSGDRPSLDVRGYEWSPEFGWPQPVVDTTVRRWVGVWQQELGGFRTPDDPKLSVYGQEWSPEIAFILANLLTPAQLWPAILQAVDLSFRSNDGPRLDIIGPEWRPEPAWLQRVVESVIAKLSAVWAAEGLTGDRSRDTPRLDVRTGVWSEQGQIFASIPATVAQLWPAILQSLEPSYRSRQRPPLDVRGYEWSPEVGWITTGFPIVAHVEYVRWVAYIVKAIMMDGTIVKKVDFDG